MARRRKIRLSTIKTAVKHSGTLLANTGSASVPSFLTVYQTTVGIRSNVGGTQVIKDTADTAQNINAGDIVKYVNICIQCSPRRPDAPDSHMDNGWLEYALVRQEEQTQLVVISQLGTKTLQDVANKQFRNNCLFTGCLPMGRNQANSLDLKIKIPKIYEKIRIGANLLLFVYYRSGDASDIRTDSHRVVLSTIYKSYT